MVHKLKGKKQTPEHIAKRVASCSLTERKPVDLEYRLRKKFIVDGKGCWVWTGAYFEDKYKKGISVARKRGQIRMRDGNKFKCKLAHRVSYEHFIGPIPDGLIPDHLCHNTLCINPEHLELVTQKVNVQRRKDSGLPYCRHGHLYTTETTHINVRGRRECKACWKERALARKSATLGL